MGAEGVIALAAGIAAGSIALISFGLDSFIEGFASLVIVWRFTGSRLYSHAAESQ
jgi:divalent metal cation (Fe/Co/Zn/Cd) transporter